MLVTAAPGEANRLRLGGTEPRVIEVRDRGAPLRAGSGCEQAAADTVRCAGVSRFGVEAGDGDDTVEIAAHGLGGSLAGGQGNDVLTGGFGSDYLLGGGGRDRLVGGPGDDLLEDGDAPAAPDADVLDGGAGVDLVDYRERRASVTARLDPAGSASGAGQAGEGDRLIAVDGPLGGSGDDVLWASDAGAASSGAIEVDDSGFLVGLSGGGGDDVLRGGRGPDSIDASQGRDRVDAGGGDDVVQLSYGRARRGARLDCGTGTDIVAYAERRDLLGGCEDVESGEGLGTFRLTSRARGAVRLSQLQARGGLRVTVRVDGGRLDGRLVAHRTFRQRPGRLRVTPLGRRLARRGARPPLRVEIRAGRRRIAGGFRLAGGS